MPVPRELPDQEEVGHGRNQNGDDYQIGRGPS